MNFVTSPMLNRFKEFKHDWEPQALRGSEENIFKNSFRDIEYIINSCSEGGTRFEFECYDTGHLYALAHFADRGLFDHAYRREVQLIFQHPDSSLNPRHRISTILSRPLRLRGMTAGAEITKQIAALLEMVSLPAEFASRFPHQLSGGEKQRVAIARAFAADPKLVICDEITAALDVSVQASVSRLLADIQRKTGAACLFITHDLNLIRQLAHRIAVMQRGKLVDLFDVADADSPDRHPYTRALLTAVPVPESEVDGTAIAT